MSYFLVCDPDEQLKSRSEVFETNVALVKVESDEERQALEEDYMRVYCTGESSECSTLILSNIMPYFTPNDILQHLTTVTSNTVKVVTLLSLHRDPQNQVLVEFN